MRNRKEIDFKMIIVRARNAKNELEVMNNRPFVCNFENFYLNRGYLKAKFLDLQNGTIREVNYKNGAAFEKEWEIVDSAFDRELVEFEGEGLY